MPPPTLISAALLTAALAAPRGALAQAEGGPTQADTAPAAPTAATADAPPAAPPPKEDKRDAFDLSADLGAGLLEFFHLDLTYLTTGKRLRRLLAFGIGVGGFPLDKGLNALMGTDDLSGSAELAGITLSGDVDTKLVSFRAFGRLYPCRKFFFGELSIDAWRLTVGAHGRLEAADYGELIDVKAKAEVWVPMIGLHGGWRFLFRSGAFLEISAGVNAFLSPGAEVTLGGTTVEQLEEYPEAAAALEDAQEFLSDALKDGANSITKKIKVFPTGTIRFGWAFDAW